MVTSFQSQKFRFWSFISMVLLVFVHGYNLQQTYLQPWTMPGEPMTPTAFTEYWLANGIFRFRIPMLFVISGYLFAMKDDRPHKARMGKRVKSLLYPYLFWSAAGLLFTFVLELFPYSKSIVEATHLMQIDEHRDTLHQYHWYETLARWIFFPVPYQLWFIRVLLIYNLAYPALRWCVTHSTGKWIFFPIAILFWLSTIGLTLIEGEGLLFFSLGIWMQKTNFNIDSPNKWLNIRIWFSVFLSLSVAKTILAFQLNFDGIEPILLLMHKLVVLSGLICAWYGCNAMVKMAMGKTWFVWMSAFSFIIYAVHVPLVTYASKALLLVPNNIYGYRMLLFIALPVAIIVLAILFGATLRKLLPGVYSFVTGGRGM